ncbi:MAG: DmpA family aminopeptidase [Candidatus Aminicenantia bacterium]
MRNFLIIFMTLSILSFLNAEERVRVRELEFNPWILKTGEFNAITDVEGVKVGHFTLLKDSHIRTGVTAILPHDGNIFQEKVPAGIYVGNGFGKLMGFTQVEELGCIETPIILTNTLSVPVAGEALIEYTLSQKGNENVRSVNPLVGECNDGYLNDIRGMHIKKEHIISAIKNAKSGEVEEGNVGAGTGTVCFGFKGGIGTASRILPKNLGGWKVGVLVQTNFGGILQMAGAPVGIELGEFYLKDRICYDQGGSCIIVVATDAPLESRQLKRLARRAMLGLAKTGGISSHGSGDYVIAFSTSKEVRIPFNPSEQIRKVPIMNDDFLSPFFLAVIEAVEEAILNSLTKAETMEGIGGHSVRALPLDKLKEILSKYNLIKKE